MASNLFLTNAVVASMADAFVADLDAGTAAIIEVYGDTQPTDADTAVGAQTKLATLTCSATAGSHADDAPGRLFTWSAITGDSSADATDTATWFRILTQAAGTTILDGNCSTAGADINWNSVSFTSGAAVDITALTLLFPES